MKTLMMVAMLMVISMLVGCRAVRTTYEYENGELVKQTVDERPFLYNKGMSATTTVAGIQAQFLDPSTGNVLPSIDINYGDNGLNTIPLTTGNDNVTEVFGTYQETLTYDKSMWGAEIGSFEYKLQAGGLGVFALPDMSEAARINQILENVKDMQVDVEEKIEDTAKPVEK